jgi:hypothetical protein
MDNKNIIYNIFINNVYDSKIGINNNKKESRVLNFIMEIIKLIKTK